MPKVEIEFTRTRRVEYSENGTIEVNVPQSVLDEDEVVTWLEEKYDNDTAFAKKVNEAADQDDESEEIDWESAQELS